MKSAPTATIAIVPICRLLSWLIRGSVIAGYLFGPQNGAADHNRPARAGNGIGRRNVYC
jgi:hypothetical protein